MSQDYDAIRMASSLAPPCGEPDYRVTNQRSLFGITPITEACRSWIDENVHFEGWQWLGCTLWVDHRCAPVLLAALDDQGFTGEGC